MSKTITFNDSNRSAYVFDDSVEVALHADRIVIGNPSSPELIIMDMNSGNATLHENVTAPDDWYGGKYLYDGSWTVKPDWVDPVEHRISELEAELEALRSS